MTRELQIADDLGTQQAVHVRGGGHLEARPQLLGHARPAHHVTPLDHQHALAGAREVGRGDEAVVAGPDDDDVVRGHGDPFDPVWVPRGALCYRRVRRTMMRTVVPLLAVAWGVGFPLTTAEGARHRPVATPPAADSTPAPAPGTLPGTHSNSPALRTYLTRGAT